MGDIRSNINSIGFVIGGRHTLFQFVSLGHYFMFLWWVIFKLVEIATKIRLENR